MAQPVVQTARRALGEGTSYGELVLVADAVDYELVRDCSLRWSDLAGKLRGAASSRGAPAPEVEEAELMRLEEAAAHLRRDDDPFIPPFTHVRVEELVARVRLRLDRYSGSRAVSDLRRLFTPAFFAYVADRDALGMGAASPLALVQFGTDGNTLHCEAPTSGPWTGRSSPTSPLSDGAASFVEGARAALAVYADACAAGGLELDAFITQCPIFAARVDDHGALALVAGATREGEGLGRLERSSPVVQAWLDALENTDCGLPWAVEGGWPDNDVYPPR